MIKVVLNKKGVGELLKSDEIKSVLMEHARATLGGLGDGYDIRETMTDRAGVNVFAATYEAKRDNLENNTILKALK